jgi:hypothetical protein
VDKCIVAQQSSVCSKGDAANVTSGRKEEKDIRKQLKVSTAIFFVPSCQLNTQKSKT